MALPYPDENIDACPHIVKSQRSMRSVEIHEFWSPSHAELVIEIHVFCLMRSSIQFTYVFSASGDLRKISRGVDEASEAILTTETYFCQIYKNQILFVTNNWIN